MSIKEYYLKKKQIIIFMLVGSGTTVFDLAVFNGIYLLVGLGALGFLIANTVAFVATNIVKYLANSRFTFAGNRGISLLNGVKFILISSGTFLLFNLFMYFALTLVPGATLVAVNSIKLLLGFVNGGVNFVLFKALVFSDQRSANHDPAGRRNAGSSNRPHRALYPGDTPAPSTRLRAFLRRRRSAASRLEESESHRSGGHPGYKTLY